MPVSHRTPAFGYVLYEDERPGEFDPARPPSGSGVRPGPEFGRLQRGETIRGVSPEQVMGRPGPGRKLVISGDTRPCEVLAIAAHGADLLIHEATFAEEERDRAAETGHSTAQQAATLAAQAEVTMLALTHFSTRYSAGRAARRGPRDLQVHGAAARLRHDRDPVRRARRAGADPLG